MTRQFVSKAVGIDLGTTNSAVALLNRTDTEIIIHRDAITGSETTPSCVWKNPRTGEVIVGRVAARREGTAPAPIRSIKRLMGSQRTARLTDADVTPEEVSATILAEMKRQIEEDVASLSDQRAAWIVDRAIVTVPAYFDQPAIEATRAAAEMAGLEVLDLLHEPTAAACFHCWRTGTRDGLFLVYDFGGGTFDVSILRCTAGVFQVLGINGNNRLGGDDMDIAIAEELRARLVADDFALDLDVHNDEEDRLRWDTLRRMAEQVKIGVSMSPEFHLHDAMGLRDKDGQTVAPIDIMFTRSEIDAIIQPIVERTIPYCFDAIEQAGLEADVTLADVDAVVLAGGSTHVPLVRAVVRGNLCALGDATTMRPADERAAQPRARCAEPVYESVDSIVAKGAAIRAAASGGLTVFDPKRTVKVSFRGLGTTTSTETHIGGSVEVLDSALALDGGTVRVSIADLDYEEEQELSPTGTFAFRRLPLQALAENLLEFDICDRHGAPLATVMRWIGHGENGRTDGGAGTAAVLAKAIAMEVTRDGKPYRRILVPALARLPVERDFDFVHPGDTERVRMPIFQNKRMIKELTVTVPPTLPRGAPISVNIQIDDLAFITVKGSVGTTPFEATVEPPPERATPSASDAASLDRRFEESVAYLPAGQQNVQRVKYEKAKGAFHDAHRRGDEPAVAHEFEEMEDVVATLSDVEGPLQPPRAFLDRLVRQCYELHRYVQGAAPKVGQPYDALEMARSIDVQRDEAERAFASSDQQAYSDALAMLKRLRDHLGSLAAKIDDGGGGGSTPPDPGLEARAFIMALREKADELRNIAQPRRPDLAQQIDEIDHGLAGLLGEVDSDPNGVRQRAQQHLAQLGKIERQLEQDSGPGRVPTPEDPGTDSKP